MVKLNEPAGHYALVSVEFMDDPSKPMNGAALKLMESSNAWKFKVEDKGDSTLQQYFRVSEAGLDVTDQKNIPAWKLVKGAELELLPFGKSVATYRVREGKFELIK